MSKYFQQSLDIHRYLRGKWGIKSKVPLQNRDDLSVAYTPGVAAVSNHIAEHQESSYALTMKGNSVAIVSDGSAVLGLGDIGPQAALPVMEGKAILFKEFADIDGVPLVIDAASVDEIVTTVKTVAPTFGGINLEDIAAPKCFEIEEKLQDIGIPVFHDDQHGTAIVLLAALINACKVTEKPIESLKVVINGAGAAGTAIARLLRCVGHDASACIPVEDVLVCDSKGIISKDRDNLNEEKIKLLAYTNRFNHNGDLRDAMKDADVFIGVSKGNLLSGEDIKLMNKEPIILAMANPIPEIMPDEALAAGASVVGTGRSDFPNQVNNVLAFPGIFRGALDARATRISEGMKIAAAHALAESVNHISATHVLPDPLNRNVAQKVAEAVKAQAIEEKLQRPD
ncbi:MAG: NADP-dependent malic enzyme [Gammaproteobacteria bacterium]|nr:NADP-dependent malic enzyme [Gammaproteobacteria bacterium]